MPTTRTKDSPFLPTDPDISKKTTYYTVYLYLDGSKLVTRYQGKLPVALKGFIHSADQRRGPRPSTQHYRQAQWLVGDGRILRSHFYSGLTKDVSLDPLHEVTVYVLEHDPDTTITLT